MGDQKLILKVSRVSVYDAYRGVFFNKGAFVKAPIEFFTFYGSDFEAPTQHQMAYLAKNPKMKMHVIEKWPPEENTAPTISVVDKVEITPTAAPVEEPSVAAPAVEEPKTEEVPVVEGTVAPPKSTKRAQGSSRKVRIR